MPSADLPSGLQSLLAQYVQAAAALLRAQIAAGAEVELELDARRSRAGARTPFYSCRPLTGAFIRDREPLLAALPEHEPALAALAAFDGLDRYLAAVPGGGEPGLELARRGRRLAELEPSIALAELDPSIADPARGRAHARTRARAALRGLLEEVFADQTGFELQAERLSGALRRLERAEPVERGEATVLLATLRGMTIASPEIKLAKGLSILIPAAVEGAPEAALAGEDGTPPDDEAEHLLVSLTVELSDPDEDPIERGRAVLLDLLRALRLYGDGRVTLGSLAFARGGGERRWRTVLLGAGGRPHGMLVVSPAQEDELRAFCSLVSRRAPHSNELAWALRRFELGCERPSPHEGLSDHLLALRALLEPEGPASGQLAGRVAALCATAKDRVRLTERMVKAQKLEREIVAGTVAERASTRALAGDVADHLRALLRDVICGHLAPDLARVADELLSAAVNDVEDVEDPSAGERQVLVEA
ncbi:MAG TPA: hypothetical protein VL972_09435 [Solirubrobacteraceae bacterium]|nr:hypothetical protein [Solirubrobacteraceae bacterium]